MEEVIVVGAGIAGARVARLLAEQGKAVKLFDYRAPWEKPCGGGLTPDVFHEFADLYALRGNMKNHTMMRIVFPSGRRASITLPEPISIIGREDLGKMLIRDAEAAGAEFIREKVMSVEYDGCWRVTAGGSEYTADLLVGAEGVNGVVRRATAGKFDRNDLCITYSKLIPGECPMSIVIRFFKGHEGYAWIFPRKNSTSVGLAMEGGGAKRDELVSVLTEFVNDEYRRNGLDPPDMSRPTAWLLPTIRRETFDKMRVCGDYWALVGDSAGSVDPVTGEGMFFALSTAELLAEAVKEGDLSAYEEKYREMAEVTIAKVAKVKDVFYHPRTLRLIGIGLEYSPKARKLARDLICRYQPYDTLRRRVYKEWPRYAFEVLINSIKFKKGERRLLS